MANKNNKSGGRIKSSGGVKKAPTKKTSKPKVKVIAKTTKKKKTVTSKTTTKKKPNNPEYVRISENAKASKFNEMGERIQKGEIKWSFYSIDGNIGYHNYLKLK
jgi:hypothetical protein